MSLFGRAILALALATAAFAVAAAIRGQSPRRRNWFQAAERAVFALFGLITVAVGGLLAALVTNDFSLKAVERYSSRALETHFKITALWASQPGSLMFWSWLLTGFACIAILTNRTRNRELMPVVVAVLASLGVFFMVLLNFVASPFETVPAIPLDGQGLTPALRNPYMIAHPPLLYLGYVSIAVPFAFAIAALVTRRLDSAWLGSIRRWTLASWTFLGIGILLGAKWAYESLTFGGYWIWDPVENAAFLPWLTATAFLHSVMVQERRGMLKVWNMVLVVTTFALTLFGTFLTRSNIVASVHNFGAQTVGPWLLGAIVVVLIVGFYLIVTRLQYLKSAHSLESYFSREAIFLYNNLLLVGLAFAVVWGTLFPVLSELVKGEKITVGRGFFDQVAAPIGFALLLLTGIGPLVPWRKASIDIVRRRFLVPLAVTAVAAPIVLLTDARLSVPAAAAFLIAIFTVVCIGTEFARGTKVRYALGGVTWLGAFGHMVARNRRRYGGYIVHIGIVVVIVGIAASRTFLTEGTLRLEQGQHGTVAGYTFTAESFQRSNDANKRTSQATVTVTRGSDHVATLRPAKNFYIASEETGDTVAITGDRGKDVWVDLARLTEAAGGTSPQIVTLHIFINPLVSWIWAGGLLFLLGAVVAAWPQPRRRRAAVAATDRQDAPA